MYVVIVDCKNKCQRERDRYLLVGFNWNIYSLVSVFWSGFHLIFHLIDISV